MDSMTCSVLALGRIKPTNEMILKSFFIILIIFRQTDDGMFYVTWMSNIG